MATITPVTPTNSGAAITYTNASGTGAGADHVATGGNHVVLLVKNTDSASHTATLAGSKPCSQGGTHDVVITVPATSEKAVLIPSNTVDATDDTVALTWSATTGMSAAAVYV